MKTGRAEQYCPCGSDRRPFISMSVAARSVGISDRERAQETTIYICPICVSKFVGAIDNQLNFGRAVNIRTRDRILGAVGFSVVTVWKAIEDKVPQ